MSTQRSATRLAAGSQGLSWTPDGPVHVRLLAVTGITTVLCTRACLALAGYPQLGGGTLHIAHALWGALLMLAGMASALLFTGSRARAGTAILGGIGLGLSADEVGKFITQDQNYFFRPAAMIIYLLFAGLLAVSSLLARRRPGDRRAIRQLLDVAPSRERPLLAEHLTVQWAAVRRRLSSRRGFAPILMVAFAACHAGEASVLIVHAPPVVGDPPHWAVAVSAATAALAALLALAGAARWHRDPNAGRRWLRAAVLVDLLVTQVFAFYIIQFAAAAGLPPDLAALAVCTRCGDEPAGTRQATPEPPA